MVTIRIVSRGDPLAQDALSLVRQQAMETWATVFGGDRWHYVEYCAIALNEYGRPVGLATLAPTDEMGDEGPNIIGVWVSPSYRRQRIGLSLVESLAYESQRQYHEDAVMIAVTIEGVALANKIFEEGIPVECKLVGFGRLP